MIHYISSTSRTQAPVYLERLKQNVLIPIHVELFRILPSDKHSAFALNRTSITSRCFEFYQAINIPVSKGNVYFTDLSD